MKILSSKVMSSGFVIKGECVMLNKYGEVYPCVDNVMHPNPGTEADEYSEIERTVDWLYRHNIERIKPALCEWIRCRVANEFVDNNDISDEECVVNVMYSDLYEPCDSVKLEIKKVLDEYRDDPELAEDECELDELSISRKIARYLNENFLRVRAGGKLNPEGTDTIYFRISSHGYDWHRVIVDFLWDTFGNTSNMPKYIWIGHDAETNPPETVLFEGTPSQLLDSFEKICASWETTKASTQSNYMMLNAKFRKLHRNNNLTYIIFD